MDQNWGTGVDMGCGGGSDPSRWRGTNILGWALMVARAQLMKNRQTNQGERKLAEVLSALPNGSRVAVVTMMGSLCPVTRGHVEAFVEARRLLLDVSVPRPAQLEKFDTVLGVVCLNPDQRVKKKLGVKKEHALGMLERRQLAKLAIAEHGSWLMVEPEHDGAKWEGGAIEARVPVELRRHWPKLHVVHFRMNCADDVAKYKKWTTTTTQESRFITMGRLGHTEEVRQGMLSTGVDPEAGYFVLGPELPGISSTAARRALAAKDIAALQQLLHPDVIRWYLDADEHPFRQQQQLPLPQHLPQPPLAQLQSLSLSPQPPLSVPPPLPPAAAASSAHGQLQRCALPGGLLDQSLLRRVDAIAQQCNCVGCDAAGLAEALPKVLPYGNSYADRRRMPTAKQFSVRADRAKPGTIDVRAPPVPAPGFPTVINMFAQWEKGKAGAYNRVQPSPKEDNAVRERWFRECLHAIVELRPRPASIAFPHRIGCGLAGGSWEAYDAMLASFAREHPDIEVLVCCLESEAGFDTQKMPVHGSGVNSTFNDQSGCAQLIPTASMPDEAEGDGGGDTQAAGHRGWASRSRGLAGREGRVGRLQGSQYGP